MLEDIAAAFAVGILAACVVAGVYLFFSKRTEESK